MNKTQIHYKFIALGYFYYLIVVDTLTFVFTTVDDSRGRTWSPYFFALIGVYFIGVTIFPLLLHSMWKIISVKTNKRNEWQKRAFQFTIFALLGTIAYDLMTESYHSLRETRISGNILIVMIITKSAQLLSEKSRKKVKKMEFALFIVIGARIALPFVVAKVNAVLPGISGDMYAMIFRNAFYALKWTSGCLGSIYFFSVARMISMREEN